MGGVAIQTPNVSVPPNGRSFLPRLGSVRMSYHDPIDTHCPACQRVVFPLSPVCQERFTHVLRAERAGELGQELVPCAVNCSQMNRSRRILFQLLAKLGNLVIDRAGGGVIVISPDFIQ